MLAKPWKVPRPIWASQQPHKVVRWARIYDPHFTEEEICWGSDVSCEVRERVVKLEHLVLGLGSRVFQQLSGNIGDHRGNQILRRPQAKLLGSLSSSPSPAFFPSSRCPSHALPSHCVSSHFHSISGPTGPSLCSPPPPRLEIALVFS